MSNECSSEKKRFSAFTVLLFLIATGFLIVLFLARIPAADAVAGPDPSAAPYADGEQVYMTRCMACHGLEGAGIPGVFPPIVKTEWVTGDKRRFVLIVLQGLTGPIDVNGETYTGVMPPWGGFMTDAEIAAVATYVRSSWGNEASSVSESDVSRLRAATIERKTPWTADDLKTLEGVPSLPD